MTPAQFKKARLKLKLSKEELAPLLGKKWRTVYAYEDKGPNGRTVPKTVKMLMNRLLEEKHG